ncbi:hypothetical protein LOF24_16120 [Sinorhizobium meliloti SM11]|uniref:hypothetical protein n=1 Tax=Rhizobium meliloti TaxID=382 RepID=UPI0005A4AFD1|nr:hypothetical protein [Sinorhizobium meliloti]MDE4559590.1 hypothetical protein [Sinorhizobium meliloti SM11]
MAVFKKSAPAVEAYRVPSLAEADSEYGAMEAKLGELNTEAANTSREIRLIEADMLDRPAPAISAGVASLLGQAVDPSLTERPAKLVALRKHASDVENAQNIVRRMLADRRSIASVAACKAVKAEYGRRVAALVSALEAAHTARLHAEELIGDLERNDVQLGYLPPLRPTFLGALSDGHVQRFAKEARENGYVD